MVNGHGEVESLKLNLDLNPILVIQGWVSYQTKKLQL